MKSLYKQVLLAIIDAAIVFISFFTAALLRHDFNIPPGDEQSILIGIVISIPPVIIMSLISGCYKDLWRYAGIDVLFRQGIVAAINIAILLIIKFTLIETVSGSITVIHGVFLFLLTTGVRIMPRASQWAKSIYVINKSNTRRVVIVGAGETGARLIKQARDARGGMSFIPVAIVDKNPDKLGRSMSGVKVAGNLDSIEQVCKTYKATEIIVALPNASKEKLYDIYKKCIKANLPIKSSRSFIDVKDYMQEDDTALKSVSIEDLLFRDVVENDMTAVREFIKDRVVMVTGGAGSIGSELCRQALANGCGLLIIYDFNENGLYEIDEELKEDYGGRYVICLGSIRDVPRLDEIMGKYKPYAVFHAAAHKHVPMLELNPFEAVKNNIAGTMHVVESCIKNNVHKFILISTDKAVNPVNILGASKRVAELIVENMNGRGTQLAAVRFGNVLGSIGSVIPKFKRQIADGGPVTVTDKEIIRYFMTISEAVSLVLTAGSLAKDGEIFVLDMGQPVKIYDLATDLIRLSGYEPGVDIKIEITGLRPGEKLYEELYLDEEHMDSTTHKKIFVLHGKKTDSFKTGYDTIIDIANKGKDEDTLRKALFELINKEVAMHDKA